MHTASVIYHTIYYKCILDSRHMLFLEILSCKSILEVHIYMKLNFYLPGLRVVKYFSTVILRKKGDGVYLGVPFYEVSCFGTSNSISVRAQLF